MNVITNDDLKSIPLSQPIEPEIELDGGYAYCVRYEKELDPHNNICPYCHQMQDWSWLNKKIISKEEIL